MDMTNLPLAFFMTLLAGLATGIGSLIAFFTSRTNKKLLSVALGFSAGIMIYVSFMEILVSANDTLIGVLGKRQGSLVAFLGFLGGILFIAIIDRLVPEHENPHEVRCVECTEEENHQHSQNQKLMKVGMMSALAITIHNVPEGLATFASVLREPSVGIAIAVAVAIHNIPEGIAVSVPIFFSTGNRKKAFVLSFLSGLSEFAGALIGFFLLMPFLNDVLFGVIFAMVAGIMVFISFDELLPTAREYGEAHLSIYGLIAGMSVMAVSLIFL